MFHVYAWLVVNGFIHTEKFKQIFDWLVQAAKEQGCLLEIKTNTELLPMFFMGNKYSGDLAGEMAQDTHSARQAVSGWLDAGSSKRPDAWHGKRRPQFVIFWDKDIRLARLLEKSGLRLFNCAQAIETCDDKSRTFIELLTHQIRMPLTIIGPKTFRPQGYLELSFLDEIESRIGYPMIIKECYGSFGQQVYLSHRRQETEDILHQIQNRPCLFQEYIENSKGRDIRIQMVGSRAVAAMYRYHETDFRANITGGGSMKPYEPDKMQITMAQTVMQALKLDFAGIDILFGEEDKPILCEVNSNAHFVNICQCTGVNAAEEIVRYCIQKAAAYEDRQG